MAPKKTNLNKRLSKNLAQEQLEDKRLNKMKKIKSENQRYYENDMSSFQNFLESQKKQKERCSEQRIANKENNQNFHYDQTAQMHALQSNECIVCLQTQFESGRYILNCRHGFCNECFIYWSNLSNECPACLKTSNSVLMILNGVSRVTNFKPKYQHEPCQKCQGVNNDEQMYYCDECQVSCVHIYCQISLLEKHRNEEWICQKCQKNKLVKNKQYRYADQLRKKQTYEDYQQFSSEYCQSSPSNNYRNVDSQETNRNKNKNRKNVRQMPRKSRQLRKR